MAIRGNNESMVRKESKIDVFSLILGVLISLAAQGIYDFIFYYATGKALEVSVTLVITALVILLAVSIVFGWQFRKVATRKPTASA